MQAGNQEKVARVRHADQSLTMPPVVAI